MSTNTTTPRSQTPWAMKLVPPFPAVASRILTLAGQESVGAREIGELVGMDPSFAAEILSFANSALFGARCRVTSLPQAVAMLGMNRVKTMATFVAVNSMVRTGGREELRKIWVHSVVTAAVAEECGRILRLQSDFAYTVGLLHNLGVLALMSEYFDEYCRMIGVYTDFHFDLLQTERDLFEIDHCEAGAYLARDWSFPESLAAAISTHHDEPAPGEGSVDNVARVAWRLADALGYEAIPSPRPWEYDELIALLPNAQYSWLGKSQDSAREKIEERLRSSPL